MKKNKTFLIVLTTILLVVGIAYFFGWEIGAYFHKDSVANNLDELTVLITKQIDEGKTGGNIYVANVSKSEISNINRSICSMNGTVSQYSILEKTRSGMKVKFKYDISDNYYVVDKYLNGGKIPGDRPQAVKLYEKVSEILSKIIQDDMSDYEKEIAIHDYIVANCEYGYTDYSREYAYRAYGCLVQNRAVCNGYAESMALLLTCAGVENKIVTGTGKGELHAWNQVCLDGKWYNVDTTWDDPLPDRGSFVGHKYFNVPDDIMDDDHIWSEDIANPCDAVLYNYYTYNDEIYTYDRLIEKVHSEAEKDPYAIIELVVSDYTEEKYGSFNEICNAQGVHYFSYSVEEYGANHLITIYLNHRE